MVLGLPIPFNNLGMFLPDLKVYNENLSDIYFLKSLCLDIYQNIH